MTNAARRRTRLTERGPVRFDVLGRDGDQALIRSVARRLSENGPDADRLRDVLRQFVAEQPTQASSAKGAVFAALRCSPLVGVELDLTRTRPPERDIDL